MQSALISPYYSDYTDGISKYSWNPPLQDSNTSGSCLDTSVESEVDKTFDSSISEDSKDSVEVGKIVGAKKRKTFKPSRSPPYNDPNFRGVTIRMENKLINSEWKLIIHTTYTLSPRKKRKFTSYVDSSEDEETTNTYPCPTEGEKEKHCASCSAKKTPLWRDAEDGTPLCNACGIRYKKYKLRCGTCWHIPKKDEFSPACRFCGSFYEYVSPRR